MNDEVSEELLDAEFRQILYMIKPLINNINDHYHLEQYKVWLERLSTSHPSEKLTRNRYLLELANQIHDNVLKPPFTLEPPITLLPSLRALQNRKQDIEWPYISPSRSCEAENSGRRFLTCTEVQNQKKKNNKPRSLPFEKLGRNKVKSENSSWCDLTDSTANEDTEPEDDPDLLTLKHKEEGLKTQEHFMKQYENQQRKSELLKKSEDNQNDNKNRKPTQAELEALKMRMKDLLDVKNALKDTQCITEDRKRNFEELEAKLKRAEQQNCELQALLNQHQKRFFEMEEIKAKEISDFKEKFTAIRQKELESLKSQHQSELAAVEKKCNDRVCELEGQLICAKQQLGEKTDLLKRKDEEIQKLYNEVKTKTSQIELGGNGEQICNLKRCISKLDKILHKNEKDYTKKIEKLKHDLEVKDMASQMQLQTQKADLLVRSTVSKQEEFNNALNNLEDKYRKMVEHIKFHALETKKQDDETIQDLKSLLIRNNIVF